MHAVVLDRLNVQLSTRTWIVAPKRSHVGSIKDIVTKMRNVPTVSNVAKTTVEVDTIP